MSNWKYSAVVTGLLLIGGLSGWAQETAPAGPRRPMPGAREGGEGQEPRAPWAPEEMMGHILENPRLAETLGISIEQAGRIRSALMAAREKEIDLRAAMEKAAVRQAQLLTAREIDEGAVMQLVDEIGRLRTEMGKLRMLNLILIRRTFKPEQLDAARDLLRERFHDRGGKRRDRSGGEREGENGEWRERMKERARREREEPS